MSEEVLNHIDDRLEKRFESYAQTQQALHEEFHQKMLNGVETQIKLVVNGKIDAIKSQLDRQDKILQSLDYRIKPFEDTRTWFNQAKSGTGWVAGFITSISLIGVSIIWLIEKIRQ